MMVDNDARTALLALARSRGVSLSALSRMLGRNAAYMQQFMTRGTPVKLVDDDRRALAAFFDVDEAILGGRPRSTASSNLVEVDRLAIEASAGDGMLTADEASRGTIGFDRDWLRRMTQGKIDDLSIIRVRGDSMAPTLADGDDVLVDRSPIGRNLRDGIYVLRRDDTLLIKRLALEPVAGTLTIASDNQAYPTWRNCNLDSVCVVGRAVWASRRLS